MRATKLVSLMSLAVMLGINGQVASQEPQPLPAPQLMPGMTVIPSAVIRPITINEFLASFQPAPGNYEIVFVHPKSGCPVKVCFSLPDGCLKKMRYCLCELKFDYGRREVEVRFKRNGSVVVDYD